MKYQTDIHSTNVLIPGFGLRFDDLYQAAGLAKLDQAFLDQQASEDRHQNGGVKKRPAGDKQQKLGECELRSQRVHQMPEPLSKASLRTWACETLLPGGTLWVSQTLPPMTEPRPIVMRPRIVASA